MKKKVLIVYTVDDDITQRRIEHLKQSPMLTDYELFYVYAHRINEPRVTLNELIFRIELSIKHYSPKIILFHTGGAFHKQPEIFRRCVIHLKNNYNKIKFGYEPKKTSECDYYFDDLNEFDKDENIAEMVTLLFFKVFNKPIKQGLWIHRQ